MPLLKLFFQFSTFSIIASAAGLDSPPVVVHEWGTFTSVAREDGAAVEWAPLLGPGDLPCFVTRGGEIRKVALRGLVRMETPVLYFYAQRPATVSVHVDFPQGLITEWYPNPVQKPQNQPTRDSRTSIEWNPIQLVPGGDPAYPVANGPSHYFAARNTDATPLNIGGENEKMIFYRGLGNFTPRLRAHYASDGRLEIGNTGQEPIPFAILFENQGGAIGFRVAESVTGQVSLEPPDLNQDAAAIRKLLEERLTDLGLYPKEAHAMVDTWADSWFSEGSRVIYIVPRASVDAVLPLRITPAPADLQRVFVGRLEILSPRTRSTLVHAVRSGDSEVLSTFGRFLQPFIEQIKRTDKSFVLSPAAQTYLRAVATGHAVSTDGYGGAWVTSDPAACVE